MAVVATENFSGAAGALQGTQTSTGGLTWACSGINQNDVVVKSIRRDGSGGGMCTYGAVLAYVNAGSANHYAQVKQLGVVNQGTASHKVICAAVACVDYNNFIALAPFYGDNWFQLIKTVGGTETVVADLTGLALASGDVFRLEREGTTVKCFKNGAAIGDVNGYTVADAVFNGNTNVGLLAYKASAAGSFDDFEAGTLGAGGGGGTLTFTTTPAANAVIQRAKGTSSKAIPIGGTYTGTTPTDLQWRLENEAGTLIAGYDWATIAGATISGGSWSASVTVPQDSARGGYRIHVRSRDNTGTPIDSKTSSEFTVGVLIEAAGQSNMEGQFNGVAAGPGLSNKCAWWSGSAWTRTSNVQFTAAVAALSDTLGLPVGFASTAVSATGARQHAPAHTSTDGAVPEGQYWASFTSLLAAMGGDLEGTIWYQGEANAAGDKQQWKDAVNARIAGIKTATGRAGAGEYSFGIVTIGKYTDQSDADMDAMRAAQVDVATTTPGAFIAADAVTYAMADAVHLTAAEFVQIAYCEGRSTAVARGAGTYDGLGPKVAAATILDNTVTVSFSLRGSTALTGTGALTGWQFYNGAAWVDATDAAVSGSTVTFTGASATQVRYLTGANPVTTNVVRGNVKAHASAANNLPVQPTRFAVTVTAGAAPVYVRPLVLDASGLIREMTAADVVHPSLQLGG